MLLQASFCKRLYELLFVTSESPTRHLLRIVSIPMVLHGLYDTLLKKQMDSLALAIAAVSFVWMALQFERLRRQETQTQIDAAT